MSAAKKEQVVKEQTVVTIETMLRYEFSHVKAHTFGRLRGTSTLAIRAFGVDRGGQAPAASVPAPPSPGQSRGVETPSLVFLSQDVQISILALKDHLSGMFSAHLPCADQAPKCLAPGMGLRMRERLLVSP